jgi:ankyrin repeat protein
MSSVATAVEAIKTGEIEKLQNLIAAEPTLSSARDENGVSLVMLSCYYRRPDAAEALLIANRPLDIWEAAALGSEEVIRQLCRQQPELIHAWSPDGFQPLHLAAFFGQPTAVQALLNLKADVNAAAHNPMSVRPIHSAVAGRNHDVVRLLIEYGADLNVKQHGGWTPLHAAAMHGDEALVNLFLDHGADRDLKSDDGQTAADLAASKGQAALAQKLNM